MDYQHKEAYCLMFYQCDKCYSIERFWNSRDGVTPFVVLARCPQCRGDMQHIDFYADEQAPDHRPYRGQGVFTDMPEALKRTYAHLRVLSFRAEGYDIHAEMEQAVANNFHTGEPFFFRWGL